MNSHRTGPRIVYIYQDQYPWEVRTQKITETLVDRDMGVVVVSRNRDGLSAQETLSSGVEVRRIPGRCPTGLRGLAGIPAFFSPLWLGAIRGAVKDYQCNLIVVRDLPLLPAAWLVGRWLETPVLLDMAENYPAMIEDTWNYERPSVIDRLIRNPAALRAMERIFVRCIDGVLVVSKQSAERVRRILGPVDVPIWEVGNTPRLGTAQAKCAHPAAARLRQHAGLKILYVGGLERARGLETVLRAVPTLVVAGVRPLVVVAGSGTFQEQLQAEARQLGIEDQVEFAGRVPHDTIPDIIDAADVGVVPHFVTPHTDTTLPNKIFDYMAQAKPVLVTQSRALIEVVETFRCGLVYRDKDPASLVAAVMQLANPVLRTQLGECGRRAIVERLNWETDAETLVTAVRALISNHRQSPDSKR